MIKELVQSGITAGVQLEKFKTTMELTELDQKVLVVFVDRIDVFERKQVELTFCFRE